MHIGTHNLAVGKQPLFGHKIDIKKLKKIPFWLNVEDFVIDLPLLMAKW